jgi:hypothetical protein
MTATAIASRVTEQHPRAASASDYPAIAAAVTGPITGYDGPGRDLVRFERAL